MSRRYDLVIVGMGSAGLTAAELASTLGLRVAAVERDRFGGECLWTGCVPSKALLASAKVAHHRRTAAAFGLPTGDDGPVDTDAVWARLRAIRQQIAATDDDPERYRAMGVDVVFGPARLTGPHTVDVGGRTLHTSFVLLCTGSRPAVPDVPGLEAAGFLTNETVFDLERAPRTVIVVGGGPVGVELGQALQRLGVQVTLLHRGPAILPRDEPALTALLQDVLVAEGVDLHLDVAVDRVEVERGGLKVVHGRRRGQAVTWAAEELLVATGGRPAVDDLGLDEVGVRHDADGVAVDDRMRTSVRSIYAVGDVAGRHHLTHAAAYEAARAVRDMFLPGRGTASAMVPWATFTDPELAHAGLTEAQARAEHGDRAVRTWRIGLDHSDRARTDGATTGAVVLVTARGRLVGAHALAPAAGELIHGPALAVQRGMKLTELASLVHVYPTLSTSVGRLAADAVFEQAARARPLALLGAWRSRRMR